MLYPAFATDFAHIGVPESITVAFVNAVPPLSVVVSYFVVNVVPVPWLLLILYDVILAELVFPAASVTHT